MIASIELQVISKILTSDSPSEIDTLCEYDASFYEVFKPHIEFILDHRAQYGDVPDVFTFQSKFPDIELIVVNEPFTYLTRELRKNKQRIILLEMFNKIKDLGSGDVTEAWAYIRKQCDKVDDLDETQPVDLVNDAEIRSE